MVHSKASTSDYWYYTGLILAQFKGLQLGYAMAAPTHQVQIIINMTLMHMYIIQYTGACWPATPHFFGECMYM